MPVHQVVAPHLQRYKYPIHERPFLQAIQKDPNFAKNVGQLVVLGGAFNASGNVNPAAEANVSLKRQKSHSRNVSCMRIKPYFTSWMCFLLAFIRF